MGNFTPAEIALLHGKRLGYLATVNARGEPHVVPCGYVFDEASETLAIGGKNMSRSKKFREAHGDASIAFVVDDRTPEGLPCGVELRGRAEIVRGGGAALRTGWDKEHIQLRPARIVAWGLDTDPYHPNSRRVE